METIRELPPVMTAAAVDGIIFPDNPFRTDGTNLLSVYDTAGTLLGQWDGRNISGDMVHSGPYTIRVTTTMGNSRISTVDRVVDLIAQTTFEARDFRAMYANGNIRITANIKNASRAVLKIYNLATQEIRSYAVADPAKLDVTWDKKTATGVAAARGVYVVAIEFMDNGTGSAEKIVEKVAIIGR